MLEDEAAAMEAVTALEGSTETLDLSRWALSYALVVADIGVSKVKTIVAGVELMIDCDSDGCCEGRGKLSFLAGNPRPVFSEDITKAGFLQG